MKTLGRLSFLFVALSLATAGWGQAVFNKFGPAAGIQKNTGATYQNTAATLTDIQSLLSASPGVVLGSASGGTFGVGTINATGLYINGSAVGIGSGSVTSVGLTAPACFGVTGSPITAAGSLGLTLSGSAQSFLRQNGTCAVLSLLDLPQFYPVNANETAHSIVPVNYFYPPGYVYRYAVNTTPGTTDMTTALNDTILAVGDGGTVTWPDDLYKTTAPILAEGIRGLTIVAAAGQYGFSGTRIHATHTGKAILSLVGSNSFTVGPVVLEGDQTTTPVTGLLLGRSSAASAGGHNFYGTTVGGYFQAVGVYDIASESNNCYGCVINALRAPFSAVYMSGAEGLSGHGLPLGSLTASSMEDVHFFGGQIVNTDTTAGSTAVYVDGSATTGHIHFYSTFLGKGGGDSYAYIRLGAIDGQGTTFPIGFHNVIGETAGGGSGPTNGIHIAATGTVTQYVLSGFTLQNVVFNNSTTNIILCDGGAAPTGVYLLDPSISTPYRPSGNLPSVFGRVDFGKLSLLAESAVTVSYMLATDYIGGVSPTITTNAGGNTLRVGAAYTLPSATVVKTPSSNVTNLTVGANRTTSTNTDPLVIADTATGSQTIGKGVGILWDSNGTGTQARIGFEVGGSGTNNESQIDFYTQSSAGALTSKAIIQSDGGVTVGTPTGGSKGAGTVNATGLYVNGAAVGVGGVKFAAGTLTTSVGGCTINQNTSSSLGGCTRTSTGVVQVTATGYSSGSCVVAAAASTYDAIAVGAMSGNTQVVNINTFAGAAVDGQFSIVCVGN